MTPEERKQAFANEYNELVKKYGVVIVAKPNNEQMSGGEIMIKLPTVDMALVDGWQPIAPKESAPSQTDEVQDVIAPTGHPQDYDVVVGGENILKEAEKRWPSNGHKETV